MAVFRSESNSSSPLDMSQASFDVDFGQSRLAKIGLKVTLIWGGRSPAPMCQLVDSLHGLLPERKHMVIPGANHMLPFTHEKKLREMLIAQFQIDAERRLR